MVSEGLQFPSFLSNKTSLKKLWPYIGVDQWEVTVSKWTNKGMYAFFGSYFGSTVYKKADLTSLPHTLAGTHLNEKHLERLHCLPTSRRAELTVGKGWTSPFPIPLSIYGSHFPSGNAEPLSQDPVGSDACTGWPSLPHPPPGLSSSPLVTPSVTGNPACKWYCFLQSSV